MVRRKHYHGLGWYLLETPETLHSCRRMSTLMTSLFQHEKQLPDQQDNAQTPHSGVVPVQRPSENTSQFRLKGRLPLWGSLDAQSHKRFTLAGSFTRSNRTVLGQKLAVANTAIETSYIRDRNWQIPLIWKFTRVFYFHETSRMRSFGKIKPLRNGELTLSFTYVHVGKLCPSRIF